MMSPVAERIYAKMNSLIKERDEVHNQINKLQRTIGDVKHHIRRTELGIVAEGASGHGDGVPDLRLAHELRELDKEEHELHDDEKALKNLTAKYSNLTKTIEDHRFWMRRADTTDPVRQREAEKKIFG
jgi:peptidoglycan hydrolase CwlO-like protein